MTLRKLLTGNPGNLEEVAEMALEKDLPVHVYHTGSIHTGWFQGPLNDAEEYPILVMTYKIGTDAEIENKQAIELIKEYERTDPDYYYEDYQSENYRDYDYDWSKIMKDSMKGVVIPIIRYLNKRKITCYEHSRWNKTQNYDKVHLPELNQNAGKLSIINEGELSEIKEGEVSIKDD